MSQKSSNLPILFLLLFILGAFIFYNHRLTNESSKLGDLEKGIINANTQFSESLSVINQQISAKQEDVLNPSWINPSGATIGERFLTPSGFDREVLPQDSFAYFLRNLPVRDVGSVVHLYNGEEKQNKVYDAVIDMDIGDKDLQQCADSVIRLRAEYLYLKQDYSNLHFNFTNGFNAEYSKWIEGNRIMVSGNDTHWEKIYEAQDDYDIFEKYLETVFTYSGTLSLEKELLPVNNYNDLQIGDVLIQGGAPGHAIIVVDIAINKTSGQKAYLLGQSYMPAQEIHILKNFNSSNNSPWYLLDNNEEIKTPEWTFNIKDLKRFKLDNDN